MAQALMTVTLRRLVGRTLIAVVGGFAWPVKARNGLAVLAARDGVCGKQLRFRSMQEPGQQKPMDDKRDDPKPALPACTRGIQLRKHLDDSVASRVSAANC